MYSLVALVSCFSVAAASLCCVPPQWEGQTGFLTSVIHNGQVTVSRGRSYMAYDMLNHKIGQIEYLTLNDGSEKIYAVLMDYNTNRKYIMNDGKCVQTALGRTVEEFGGCIPDNTTVVGTDDVLGFSSNDLNMNTYALDFPGVKAYIGLTSDACVPVMETIRGEVSGNVFIQQTNYFNISAGISDSSSLQSPPKGCENAPLLVPHFVHGHFDTNIVGKRSFLGF